MKKRDVRFLNPRRMQQLAVENGEKHIKYTVQRAAEAVGTREAARASEGEEPRSWAGPPQLRPPLPRICRLGERVEPGLRAHDCRQRPGQLARSGGPDTQRQTQRLHGCTSLTTKSDGAHTCSHVDGSLSEMLDTEDHGMRDSDHMKCAQQAHLWVRELSGRLPRAGEKDGCSNYQRVCGWRRWADWELMFNFL